VRLLLGDRFPQIWVPNWENRDLRQLLWHRHGMVQAAHPEDEPTASRRDDQVEGCTISTARS